MTDFFQSHTLEKLIQDDDMCNIYEEYLASHFAWENFGFWYEVQQYKQEQDVQQRAHMARIIFEKFLKSDSIFELGDVDIVTRDTIESCLENPPLNMFDFLQKKAFDTLAQSTLQPFKADYNRKFVVQPAPRQDTFSIFSCFGR
mmetsp:Transcript_16996/g.21676  ORF Transcript_16996/g.21676 Transcript_16996/m.21676 type:complete len:144 (-) Transcript_16996:100-531(-)